MPTPDFVLELRRAIGNAPLWLSGVTAVIVRGDQVLLARRADNGLIAPIAGVIDPGEEPAAAAVREALEETGVVIEVERFAWLHVIDPVTYENGDVTVYLDHTFRCRYVSGDPHPADGENTEVMWVDVADLDDVGLTDDHRRRIEYALSDEVAARFEL
jgi:8-oxo-dGTP pyrophosphatase MutT (NUDIX family)